MESQHRLMPSSSRTTVGGLYLLPFFIFFTVASIALLQPGYGGRVQQESSLLNQIVLSLAYLIAFKFLLKQQGLLPWALRKAIPLNTLLFFALISLFWSDFPGRVLISFIHNVGLFFISLCMVVLLVKDKDKFFKLLLFTLFLYMLTTIAVTLIKPDIGIMTSQNIYDVTLIGRWRGLTSHPNSLGAICLFTSWIAVSTFFHTTNKKWVSWLAVITLIAAFYCAYKANSMTSLLLSIALGFGMLWYAFIGASTGGIKFFKIFFGFMALLIGLQFLYVLHPELFSEKYLFKAIGRDTSLSGRASLWEFGFQGFAAKPFFGWSYDSLNTFLKYYHMPFGQLHNGYLDLLVRGGLVSVFFFALLLLQIARSLIKQAFKNNKDYIFISGLIIVVLMHNITEASFITNTNIIWAMFLIGYFYSITVNYYRS